jgi:glyoxylase-like metal-dependent hydrolase (beta-lactamase superfamily II)
MGAPGGDPGWAATVAEFVQPVPRDASEARAHRLAEGVWSLVLPLAYRGLRSVNAYLLALSDGLCLVDCGSGLAPGWDALVHALHSSGHAPSELTLLVCTHLHQDHAGLAATVAAATGCELARPTGPGNDHDILRDRTIPLARRRRRARREGVPPDQIAVLVGPIIGGDGDHERARFDRELPAGTVLRGPAGDWEVVAIGGHAAAQLGLFDSRRRWLMSADLLGGAEVPMLQYGGLADPLSEHLESIERVSKLAPARLLPGHGRPIDGGPAIRRLLAAARASTLELRETAARALQAEELTAYELAQLLGKGSRDLEWRQTMMSVALCALEHLVLAGAATDRIGSDGVRRFASASARRPA